MSLSHRLIAHRGWQRHYPENTLIGIEAAISAGARHVEIDVHLTADHQAVLCHDLTLERIGGVNIDINTLNLSQLKEYSAYEPQRLGDKFKGTPFATLAECVALVEPYGDVSLYVEIKRKSLFRFGTDVMLHAVLPLLQSIRSRCFVISFDVDVLEQARRAGWQKVAPVLTSLDQLHSEAVTTLKPEMVFCDSDLLTESGALRNIPYPTALYEIDQPQDARHWFDRGAALVETFAVGELIAALRESANA